MSEPPGDDPTFMEKMLARFHALAPDVAVVRAPQEPAPRLFGVFEEQVGEQSTAALATALGLVRELWPVVTDGLPAPARAAVWWTQQSSFTTELLAVASARHTGFVPGRLDRVDAAQRALAGDGWLVRRRDPQRPRYLRLTASRARTLVEVSSFTRPDAYDVEVRCGPVPVGRFGGALLGAGIEAVPFAV
jgi:hypothetical protein